MQNPVAGADYGLRRRRFSGTASNRKDHSLFPETHTYFETRREKTE
jgi:hypothetical protein